ncbi:MAG: S1/P1 nuclease, partial [Pseudomonadales bacterium]
MAGMIVRIRTLVLLLGLVASPAALGWGHEGHKLICALAEESLSDKAQAMVNQLVGAGEAIKDSSRSFAEACLWPDRVKGTSRQDTYEHHFINVPDDAQRIDIARDCSAMNCLAVGIQRALRYLAEPAKGRRAKARQAAALRYLGH